MKRDGRDLLSMAIPTEAQLFLSTGFRLGPCRRFVLRTFRTQSFSDMVRIRRMDRSDRWVAADRFACNRSDCTLHAE